MNDRKLPMSTALRLSYGYFFPMAFQVMTGFVWLRYRIRRRFGTTVRPSEPEFEVVEVATLSWPKRATIRVWLAGAHVWRTRWAGFDWYALASVNGRRASIAGLVDRCGKVGETPMRLGLIGGVLTVPRYRGEGLASEVMARITRFAFESVGCDLCVLICGDNLVGFYERHGWRLEERELVFERFGQRLEARSNVMVLDRPHPIELPDGPIDVMGLPA